MSLPFTFAPEQITQRPRALTYDDVLLVPALSGISSRSLPILKTRLTKKIEIHIPIISANMDTITEKEMALAMAHLGGVGILHRFMPINDQVKQVQDLKNQGIYPIAASVGIKPEDRQRAQALVNAGVDILTVDIANGYLLAMHEFVAWCKKEFPHVEIIAGNVASGPGAKALIEAGADAVKVGIGPGSMCTTRLITGVGVPQLTAIAWCAQACKPFNVPIIADGGIRHPGDIVKALAAGADTVMVGWLLAGTQETPGPMIEGQKIYRGMASRSAQESWRGGLPLGMAPEGESRQVAFKGSVKELVPEILGGIRSAMTYLNASNIAELRKNALFVEITPQGWNESVAHGLLR